MGTLWTLAWNGTEHALADWGMLADVTAQFANKDESVISFRTTEDFDPVAVQFTAFKTWLLANPAGNPTTQIAKVYRDRDSVGVGGSVYFQGYWDDPAHLSENGKEYMEYRLCDVLSLFKRNPFKQYRKQSAGFTVPGDASTPMTFVNVVAPEVFLGEKFADGSLFKESEQLQEIIDWMNETYNPTRQGATVGMNAAQDIVQAGTLNPAAKIPKYRANTVFCMDALNIVSRWIPDVLFKLRHTTAPPTLDVLTIGKWNYATTPPTFLDYTNLPEVTINITADQETSIRLQGQSARKYAGVIIYYSTSDTVDGVTRPILFKDSYVPGVDVSFGAVSGTTVGDFKPEVPSHFVELEGSKLVHVSADVQVTPIADAVSGTAANRKNWWLAHDQTLNDSKVDQSTIAADIADVVDDSGTAIDLTEYPNELKHDCHIPKWMKTELGTKVIRAHVRAHLAFEKYFDDGQTILDATVRERPCRKTVKLTNAVTQTYTAIKSFDSGEIIPQGVAESVYRGAAIDQWAGKVTFSNDQLRSDIFIGCRLKLIGPHTTFTNVIPQLIMARPHYGTTDVQYGATAPPDAEGLIELARATRGRLVYNMPSGRDDGEWGGGSAEEIDDSAESPLGDTAHGIGGHSYFALTSEPV
jgi:hypothetical protein